MTEPEEKLSLIEEQLVVDKLAVRDGRVRISTKTEFVTENAEARLDSENVESGGAKVVHGSGGIMLLRAE
jgi:hypothetical protein